MEHPQIDDEAILDRYLVGRLSEADEALFEEHLFACAACLEHVQSGEALRRGLRAVAAEDAARATATLGLLAWWRGQRPVARLGLAGLAMLVALLPAVLLWQQLELRRIRGAGTSIARGGVLAAPMGNLQVVSLGVVRGNEDRDGTAVRPDPEKGALVLSLALPTIDARVYRVTVHDAAGTERWRGDGLEPNLYDTLMVILPSTYLVPGRYRITVEAQAQGDVRPVGEMALRILE